MPYTDSATNGITSSTGYRSAIGRFDGTKESYPGWRLQFEHHLKDHEPLLYNCIGGDEATVLASPGYAVNNGKLFSALICSLDTASAVLIDSLAENNGREALVALEREFVAQSLI